MKMADLFFENPLLLLMMEHFDADFVVHDKTIEEVCAENNISKNVFVAFANLYNGFYQSVELNFSEQDVLCIIAFLRNTHQYYLNEKYPEIRSLIEQMYKKNETTEIKLIEKFFQEYFEEVVVHLDYEDKNAFPYFTELMKQKKVTIAQQGGNFSADVYNDHHTDIEYKLDELKNLLLKHIPLKEDRTLRRKLLFSLFELEYDLNIHTIIESTILTPLIKKIEKSR